MEYQKRLRVVYFRNFTSKTLSFEFLKGGEKVTIRSLKTDDVIFEVVPHTWHCAPYSTESSQKRLPANSFSV